MSTVAETAQRSKTPSGIEIIYQESPRRLYRVYDPAFPENGEVEVPSVTTVLGVLDKPALPWWGMKVGVEGVLLMIQNGMVGRANGQAILRPSPSSDVYAYATTDGIVEALKTYKLTVNHVKSKAGDRGVAVHRAFEAWAEDRSLIPDPAFYGEEERGYVEGLRKFLTDLKVPARSKANTEVMVGSVEHGFAGRYDLSLAIGECELVTKVTPVRGEQREVFEKGRILADLKTSKSTYASHHLQLAAYELASVECGYKSTDYQIVVRVDAGGYYEVTRNTATAEDFLAVKGAYDTLASMKGRK